MTFRDIIGSNGGWLGWDDDNDGSAWHEHDAADISGEAVFTDLKVDRLLGGKITGKEIVVAGGVDGILRSDNFLAGSTGWRIRGDGSAEFNDVTVRGDIISGNWDGADPVNLATFDNTATAGFAVDSSAGAAQFSGDMFVSGNIEVVRQGATNDKLVIDASDFGSGNFAGPVIQFTPVTGSRAVIHHGNSVLKIVNEITAITGGHTPYISLAGSSNGQITLGSAQVRALTDGSASAPFYSFTTDPDTGIYRAGSNNLRLVGGGTAFLSGNATQLISTVVRDNTTAASANVNIHTTSGLLARSTSSRRYKRNLRSWDHRASVLNLAPTLFRSKASLDDPDLIRLGLIAEDVAENFPLAAIPDDEGRPDAIDWNAIVSGLVAEVQQLRARVGALEAA